MKELEQLERQMVLFAWYFEKRYFEDNLDASYWVANEVGGVFSIADYFFSMEDMVQFIRHDYSEKDMMEKTRLQCV